MQVPLSQAILWPQVMTPTEQFIAAQSQSHNMVIPQPLGQDALVSVPIMLKNGWVVPGISQPNPHPATYVPQPLQYVTVQTRFNVENGGVEKQLTAEQFLTRPVLIPRGPVSRGNHVSTCGRSLRGNNYATRRQSEEKNDGKQCINRVCCFCNRSCAMRSAKTFSPTVKNLFVMFFFNGRSLAFN